MADTSGLVKCEETSLAPIAEQLSALRRLPEGYGFWVQPLTDNLLVVGPTLSFCITREMIADDRHVNCYAGALEKLIECENEGGAASLMAAGILPATLQKGVAGSFNNR